MLKVLIVDDEVIVRVGIKSVIDWEANGFQLIGEATNGQQALEMIMQDTPDIVVTDIKMPLLDGIGLIKGVKQAGLQDVRFIVLSCHDDFAMVKEAMKLGAEEYFLKLEMEPEELLKELLNLKGKIEGEQKAKEEKYIVQKNLNLNMPVLREKFFQGLLSGSIIKEYEVQEKVRFLGIELDSINLFCLVLWIDGFHKYSEYSDNDMQLTNFAVMNIVAEILDDFKPGYIFYTKPGEFIVLVSVKGISSIRQIWERNLLLAGRIRDLLRKYMDISVSIGISNSFNGLLNVRNAYSEAAEAVGQRYFRGSGSLITYDDVGKIKPLQEDTYTGIGRELEKCMKNFDVVCIETFFNKLLDCMSQSPIPKDKVQIIYLELVFSMKDFIQGQKDDVEKAIEVSCDPYRHAKQIETLDDARRMVSLLKTATVQYIHSKSGDKFSSLVSKVRHHVDENFNRDLSLNNIAVQFGITSSYLSSIFSQETGQCLTDYITNVRIEKAKEYIRNTNMKIYEIAEAVGYQNIYYFSKIFKKVTGVSPLKYKGRH